MLAAKRKQSCMRISENWERVERLRRQHLTALLTAEFRCFGGYIWAKGVGTGR